MRISFIFFAVVLFVSCTSEKTDSEKRMLVFSKTTGFRHSSIGPGKIAMLKLGTENGYRVDTTENAAFFHEDSLKNYNVVVFLNTTGDVLDATQEVAFERYIQSGGGFVGIHSSTDTEYDWGWYGKMVGGYFQSHPEIQDGKLTIHKNDHPSTEHLGKEWVKKDEWYNFKKLNPNVTTLITLDETSYRGGENGTNHPISWYHSYDGGRAFYTAMGHTDESYSDTAFLKHVAGGIKYAAGESKPDFSKAKSVYAPDSSKFQRVVLNQGFLFEPTEMTILPNGDVLIAQRRGDIALYKASTKEMKSAGKLNVYWSSGIEGVNAEEGLLGIQKDPQFANNNRVYIFYSPADTSVNRLSRFEFRNDSIVASSEKVILQFYSQRQICCHTGGSIAFGPDGVLYVSTGDNSTPFDQPRSNQVNRGFAPIDDRPGRLQYDARRSSANTNDLRGKIIRIKVNEDGSYSIPQGNLFAEGTANARPEIFVMGTRNPYRISVDQKSGYLYWGEVGPDSPKDSFATRGPQGYDEINQAKRAGFFGWPLFVGANYAYREFDYNTGRSGNAFDTAQPQNNSRNNTGLKTLPPAQPAFIWYPYGISNDFPQMGAGGRTAMAGPVYYAANFPEATRLPDYYNGKLFIYEWMRNWIKAVTLDENGNLYKIEPFMNHAKFAAPVDMELGPDGKLYVLEYGKGWFAKNPDAGLSVIEYRK